MIYTLPESQDAKLSNSAYGIVFGSVFMEIWTNLSTLQHHCNIFFAHCMFGHGVVSFGSKKQPTVALSTAEAEYMAAVTAG